MLDGKKSPGDLISSDKAAAVQLYGDMSRSDYEAVKKVSDESGKHFLPNWNVPLDERKKCVSPDLKVTDKEAVASIKGVLDNHNLRQLQDPHVFESVDRIEKKHGKKAKFELAFKGGYDGVTTVKYDVRISNLHNITDHICANKRPFSIKQSLQQNLNKAPLFCSAKIQKFPIASKSSKFYEPLTSYLLRYNI